jgi:phosphatidylserine/phosphatidylglycerophosphate/cardiolipin synthase-like enzyme
MTKFLGPYFSRPKVKHREVLPDFALFEELKSLFSRIKKGTFIRMALYMWNQKCNREWRTPKEKGKKPYIELPGNPRELTDIFIEGASQCDTKMILDQYSLVNHEFTVNRFQEAFGYRNVILDNREGMNDPEVRLELALNEEMAKEGYMHDKFFLFSELEGIGKWVIVQMTANINYTQYHQYNNVIIMYDDKELFDMFVTHWEDLRKGIVRRTSFDGWSIRRKHFKGGRFSRKHEVFFFPRKKCPIEAMLRDLAKTATSKTKVNIAMSFLTRIAYPAIFKELLKRGCQFKLILSEEYQNTRNLERYKKLKVPYSILRNAHLNEEWFWDDDLSKKKRDNWRRRMHHKYVLIEHQGQKTVWTGSYNLTHPGLRLNDETVLRIEDPNVYDAYMQNFKGLLRRPRKKPKYII